MTRISINLNILSFVFVLGGVTGCSLSERPDPARYVDPFIGTAYVGHTHPAAQLPFGMVQVGPDTGTDTWEHCSSYSAADSSIIGFSHTHLSGTGCPDMGDIMIMPVTGNVIFDAGSPENTLTGYRSRFSHQNEEAHPGYYKVILDKYAIKTDLTATSRVGFHKYTYPESGKSGIMIDLGHGIGDISVETRIHFLNDSVIVGQRPSSGFAPDHNYYFCAIFSKPVEDFISYSDGTIENDRDVKGQITKMLLQFKTEKNEEILVKVALSTVSEEGAEKNLNMEIPGWNFAKVRQDARDQWNEYLGKIEFTPVDNNQKISLYTSLYHALLMPNVISDVDKNYRLPDGKLINENRDAYTNFSLWDTYRATHSFYNLLYPEKNTLFIKTMLSHYQQYGILCTNEYGYYPFDLLSVESVLRTMEHCYDDYCASLFFATIDDTSKQAFFKNRSDNYKKLFDYQNGLMRAKDSKGAWRKPFDKFVLSHAGTSGGDYTEGNAWQYTWHVQHAIPDLAQMMGGQDAFETKLDSAFSLNVQATSDEGFHGDVTGMIGQYAHGNEPSHHVAYLYNYTSHPGKTQDIIRKVFDLFYLHGRKGLSGNDDCGQMSAWYIFSAIGFYPVDPVSGEYLIGAPQVHEAKLHLPNEKIFEMKARNLSASNKYIHAARLNGKPLKTFKINYDEIKNGGLLEFDMTDDKDSNFFNNI